MADKALLVGINQYPDAPLNGCVNDIEDMGRFLKGPMGFTASSLRVLKDGDATTQHILQELQSLVRGAKAGDRLFFHYSGHGAQVPTRTPSGEVDGLDEVICPVDFDWEDPHLIRDKQFRTLFSAIPAGVAFAWVSDSCHSGDLLRVVPHATQRPRVMTPPPGHPLAVMWSVARAKPPKLTPQPLLNGVLISGCRSNQTSADAFIAGRYNGACTYHLVRQLWKNPTAPLTTIVHNVNEGMVKDGFTQRPGLEGSPTAQGRSFLALR